MVVRPTSSPAQPRPLEILGEKIGSAVLARFGGNGLALLGGAALGLVGTAAHNVMQGASEGLQSLVQGRANTSWRHQKGPVE